MITCVWLTHPQRWLDCFYVTMGNSVDECRQLAIDRAREDHEGDVEELKEQQPTIHATPVCMVFEVED
jgi:hypothetical protein